MSIHIDKYWQTCKDEQNKRIPLGPLNPGLHFPPDYLPHLQNLEKCLCEEFDEKINQTKLELEEQKKSSMKTTTWIEQQLPQELAKTQKQIQELSEALVQVQHENKSLRDELQSLRATLVEVLDALTANVNGSPKDGPCANSSSEQ